MYGDSAMLRWLLLPLLLLTTSEKVAFAGIVSAGGVVSVKVYGVGVAAIGEMVGDAVATSVVTAPIVVRSVTRDGAVVVARPCRCASVSRRHGEVDVVQRERGLQRHVHREGLRLVVAVDGDGWCACRVGCVRDRRWD